MKLSYLIKATPFLSTLVLIIFLSISNQKEYTKIKILIWSTPSLRQLSCNINGNRFYPLLLNHNQTRKNNSNIARTSTRI